MSTSGRVLVSRPGAPWLPEGGRADVVLAGPADDVPSPVCLARLLVTRGSTVLVEPRPDGLGPDLPTCRVRDGVWQAAVEELVQRTGCAGRRPGLLGHVRNTVVAAPPDYPWPSPQAYFAVWHCSLPVDRDAPGTWLDETDAQAQLGERHWWPLAAWARASAR